MWICSHRLYIDLFSLLKLPAHSVQHVLRKWRLVRYQDRVESNTSYCVEDRWKSWLVRLCPNTTDSNPSTSFLCCNESIHLLCSSINCGTFGNKGRTLRIACSTKHADMIFCHTVKITWLVHAINWISTFTYKRVKSLNSGREGIIFFPALWAYFLKMSYSERNSVQPYPWECTLAGRHAD